jgi:hypothetical protein
MSERVGNVYVKVLEWVKALEMSTTSKLNSFNNVYEVNVYKSDLVCPMTVHFFISETSELV